MAKKKARDKKDYKYKKEKRIDTSIILKIEKKLGLDKYIIKKIPPFVTPRMLNTSGFIGAFIAGLCFFLTMFDRLWFIGAILGILIYFFCDRYDGRLARATNTVSKRGFYADHMFDTLAVLIIMLGLGLSGVVHIYLALAIIIVYYVVAINIFLMTYISGTFNSSFLGFSPAEALSFIILLSFLSLILPYPLVLFWIGYFKVTLFNLGAILALGVLIYGAVYSIIRDFNYMDQFEKRYQVSTFWEYMQKTRFVKDLKQANKDFKALIELDF